jgi:signal transduction histidine kinase
MDNIEGKAIHRRGPSRSELQKQISELVQQQAAIAEVLHAIATSPHELQPTLQTIVDSAARLCRAEAGTLRLVEKAGLRLVAQQLSPAILEEYLPPVVLPHDSFLARQIASKSPAHIPDLAAHELHRAGMVGPVTLVKGGVRTLLIVPMLRNDEPIGVLVIGRRRIEHFSKKEIELVTDFTAQAAIALEIISRERQSRELQMELAHANRVGTMGQLSASITHEVNQPIAAARNNVVAALRFLDSNPPDLQEVREALASAVNDTDRAGVVIARMRALIQKAPCRSDHVSINEAVREVIELTRGEALKHGVSVKTKFTEALPIITGDRVQLQQVVLNLILNALQEMDANSERGREVLITTSQTELNDLCIGIRDTGPGLSPETLLHLFEPFYTTKPHGMGMGLAICRSIVEAHGGRLWATACQPHGALFQFTIPAGPG